MRLIKILVVGLMLLLLSGCGGQESSSTAIEVGGSPAVSLVDTFSTKPLVGINTLTGELGAENDNTGDRPIAVMVNNIATAVPQNGLSEASIIYEMLTEGGITRFLAFFSNVENVPEIVGPVRSARSHFVEVANSYGAVYVHFGGSVTGYATINNNYIDDVDGYVWASLSYVDWDLAEIRGGREHATYITNEKLVTTMDKIGNDLTLDTYVEPYFNFSYSNIVPEGTEATTVKINISNYITGYFDYDTTSKQYIRSEYGGELTDLGTGEKVAVDKVFILYDNVYSDPNYAKLKIYDLDSGYGYYLNQGVMQKITWEKDGFDGMFTYYTEDGSELVVNTGTSWIIVTDNEYYGGAQFS